MVTGVRSPTAWRCLHLSRCLLGRAPAPSISRRGRAEDRRARIAAVSRCEPRGIPSGYPQHSGTHELVPLVWRFIVHWLARIIGTDEHSNTGG